MFMTRMLRTQLATRLLVTGNFKLILQVIIVSHTGFLAAFTIQKAYKKTIFIVVVVSKIDIQFLLQRINFILANQDQERRK